MKISQKGLYALQAMMMLARHYHQGAIKIRDIAYEEGLPEKFLELILLELKNARMVESVRGAKGGYQLRRDPSEIHSERVIRLIDGPLAPFGDADQLRELIERDLPHRSPLPGFPRCSRCGSPHSRQARLSPIYCRRRYLPPRPNKHHKNPEERIRQHSSYGGREATTVNKALQFTIALLVSFEAFRSGLRTTPTVIRVGAFPNVTHAQAMVGKANGWFDKSMGSKVKIQWTSFNAGPSAIEALFAGAIDMTYVGPNPAINGYVRSNGEALRVVAGAASGGASLIVRNDSGINKPEDFHGKRVASPQFGNTQDVALRNWLKNNGLKSNDKGGDVANRPHGQSGPVDAFSQEGSRCGMGSRTLGHSPDSRRQRPSFCRRAHAMADGQFVIGLLVVNRSSSTLIPIW